MQSIGHWLLFFSWIPACMVVSALPAAEPCEAFLEALRQERYFDVALIYLDRLDARKDTPAAFQQSIPYQRALLSFAAADESADLAQRMRLVESAEKSIGTAPPSTADPAQAVKRNQLRLDILAAKAQLLSLQSFRGSDGDRNRLRAKAADAFAEAIQAAEQLTADLKERLAQLEKTPAGSQDIVLRDSWRTAYLAGQIAVPKLVYESAQLFVQDPPEYRQRIKTAVAACQSLLEKYSTRRPEAYLELMLLSGRCHQALEDYGRALSYYTEILENTTLPDRYSAMATQLAMECWSKEENGDKLAKAVSQGESWLKAHPRAGPSDAAPVRIALARCMIRRAESTTEPAGSRTLDRARGLLVEAARAPGRWRREAEELLAELPASPSAQGEPPATAYSSFAEARLAGDTAFGSVQTAEQAMSAVARQAGNITAERRRDVDKELAQSRESVSHLRRTAISAYRRALDLVDAETPIEDVTQTQFLLAYLMYQEGEYYDAAVLAEFVARRRSDSAPARSSIRTAMAAFAQLLELHPEHPEFAEKHLARLATFASQRWPQDDEGLTATVTLVRLLTNQGRIDDAKEYLERIPPTSPWRAEAEITIGIALFRQYQRALAQKEGSAEASSASVEPLRRTAQELLKAGLSRGVDADVTDQTILATLTLAQIQLDEGDAAAARQLLSDPRRGPFALLQQESPPAVESATLILQTELRARLLTLGTADPDLDEILQVLAGRLGRSPDGKARLVGILVPLASEWQDRVEKLPADERLAAVHRLDTLLAPVVDATDQADILSWVGDTLLKVTDLPATARPATKGERDRLLALAERALQKAIKSGVGNEEQRLENTLRLAAVHRRQRDFRAAIPLFAEVLRQKPNLLNVQMEAARTYQEGGAYPYAIKGGRPDPQRDQNAIWGWEKISTTLARQMKQGGKDKEKYASLFHEARCELTRCRYRQALGASGPARARYLEQARRTVAATAALYPQLGGPEQKREYEALLRDIAEAEKGTRAEATVRSP